MHKPLRFGLIGAGGVGALHLTVLRRLQALGRVELVAIADPSDDCRLRTLDCGLVSANLPWYRDYRELLETGPDLDIVTIATPIPFHFEMAQRAIARGLYVHLEKPPVPLIQQLTHLIASDSANKVSVGFQFITSHCMMEMKQLVASGALGKIRSIRAVGSWPRLGNYYSRAAWAGRMSLNGQPVFDGPLTNALAHLVHNLMHLASPMAGGYATPVEVAGELYRARPIESYDSACVRGVFENETEFTIAVTHASQITRPFELRVEGSNGWARLSADGARLESSTGLLIDYPESTEELIQRCYDRLTSQILDQGERVATRLTDTLPYVLTTNAAYLSSGGVHDIAESHYEIYEKGGEQGYHVHGINDALEQVMATGRLFSELNVPWATASPQLLLCESIERLDFDLPISSEAAAADLAFP